MDSISDIDFEIDIDLQDPNFTLDYSTDDVISCINAKIDETRSDRIRRALFPETFNQAEIDQISYLRIRSEVPSALEKLSQPALELKSAIIELLEFAQDVDLASKFVPEIIKLLQDTDLEVVRNAAELTQDCTFDEAPARVIIDNPQMVATLEKVLDNLGGSKIEGQIKEAGTGALLNLTKYEKGRHVLFETGGISYLVKLLGSENPKVVSYALQSLYNLLQYQEGTKTAIISAGGIQKMVPLLQMKDIRFLTMLMDCLQRLCFKDTESKLAVRNCKGPRYILAIIKRSPSDSRLLLTLSRLLKVLSTCIYNKEDFADQGLFYFLAKRLPQIQDPVVFKNFLTTLRNISDANANFYIDHEVLDIILTQLKSDNEDVVDISAGILGNLTSHRPSKKVAVYECDGVETILKTMLTPRRPSTMQALILTLRHMSARHRLGKEIRAEIRKLSGVELIIQTLQTSIEWVVLGPTVGLIRNLANMTQNHKVMEEYKVVARLCELIGHTVKAIALLRQHEQYEDKDEYQTHEYTLEGTDLKEILIDCIGSLALLVHRKSLKKEIDRLNILSLIQELGNKEGEEIKTVVVEFFNAYNDTYTIDYDTGGNTLTREHGIINHDLDDPGYEVFDDSEVVGGPKTPNEVLYENTSSFNSLDRSIIVTNPNDPVYQNDTLTVRTAPSRASSHHSIRSSGTMEMSMTKSFYSNGRVVDYEDHDM